VCSFACSASPFVGYPSTQDHAVQKSYLTSQPPVATVGSQPLPSISLIQTAFPMFNPNIPPPLSSLSGHSGSQPQQSPQTRFMPSLTSDLTTIPKPLQATMHGQPPGSSANISKGELGQYTWFGNLALGKTSWKIVTNCCFFNFIGPPRNGCFSSLICDKSNSTTIAGHF
jgi:hypothetical protein